MNAKISERRQCYQCDEHLLENWPSDYCANCRPVRALQSQPEVQQGEKKQPSLSELAQDLDESADDLIRICRSPTPSIISIRECADMLKTMSAWLRRYHAKPSLKSQLEAVVGELEKEADNWKGKTYISFGLKFKNFANRLRELLKGLE